MPKARPGKPTLSSESGIGAQIVAGRAVHLAIAEGRLPRLEDTPCIRCWAPATEYHHHRGYAPEHRLDVVPMCRPCHYAAHRTDRRRKAAARAVFWGRASWLPWERPPAR